MSSTSGLNVNSLMEPFTFAHGGQRALRHGLRPVHDQAGEGTACRKPNTGPLSTDRDVPPVPVGQTRFVHDRL